MRLRKIIGFAVAAVLLAPAGATQAGVIELVDREEWFSLVGPVTTVDFTGFAPGTFITDQYADLGILFTDGNDSIHFTPSFPNDGVGLDGNGNISLVFDTPQAWIGVDFPGLLTIELYSEGRLFFTSNTYGGGVGNFLGLVSSELFDAAVLIDPGGEAEIDDLHFGVPTPGALWLLGLSRPVAQTSPKGITLSLLAEGS